MGSVWHNNKGLSLIELVVTMTILAILASVILPSTKMNAKRMKELELRRDLRMMRTAIDDFNRAYLDAVAQKKIPAMVDDQKAAYPKTLDVLVEGYDFGGLYSYKRKFLRRIPADPFMPTVPDEKPKWGLRSSIDQPDSTTWGEENVFDVYSLSEDTAIDGTKYKDW
jgi:general secretion pathway protein G